MRKKMSTKSNTKKSNSFQDVQRFDSSVGFPTLTSRMFHSYNDAACSSNWPFFGQVTNNQSNFAILILEKRDKESDQFNIEEMKIVMTGSVMQKKINYF